MKARVHAVRAEIVVAEDVHDVLETVETRLHVVAAAVTGRVESSSDDAGGRAPMARALGPSLFADLVADAPHDDARVIAVTPHHVPQILFGPIGKEQVVVIRRLLFRPAVEGFIQDQEAHPVGQVEQLGAGGLWLVRIALQPISLSASS